MAVKGRRTPFGKVLEIILAGWFCCNVRTVPTQLKDKVPKPIRYTCYMEKTNSCTHQPLHTTSSIYGISSGADQDLSPQRGSENFEGITHHVPLSSRQMIHEENKQLHASTASYRLKHLWNQFWCRPRSLPTTWVGEL